MSPERQIAVRRYNQRMARRIARRAHVADEGAVAVAFTFNNLFTATTLGVLEDLVKFVPIVGVYIDLAASLLGFWFHRIVLVTEESTYVFRDWPFHIPGEVLMKHPRGPGTVALGSSTSNGFMRFIRRGQLTFQDGRVVYHGFIWIKRARYIAQEANLPRGE